jgi:hypothetical protein
MMKPSIHLNGTSRDDLFDGYMVAMAAVEAAIDALVRCAPHGRDYYPQGDDAWKQAYAEHDARLRALNSVSRELTELAAHTS